MNRAFILQLLLVLAQALASAQQPANTRSDTPTCSQREAGCSTPGAPQSDSGHPMWVRVSQGFMMGLQVKKVAPHYPEAARRAGIQGSVLVQAHIDTNGDVVNLRVVSGDPALAAAAIDAVKQWKYKPFLLNGQAVKVETAMTVQFQLHGNSTEADPVQRVK